MPHTFARNAVTRGGTRQKLPIDLGLDLQAVGKTQPARPLLTPSPALAFFRARAHGPHAAMASNEAPRRSHLSAKLAVAG